MSNLWLWYATRGTGVVALVLLTLTLVLGIVTRGGRPLPGLPRFAVVGLHRDVSLLSVVFLALHVVTAVSDGYSRVGWLEAVLPITSGYRPLWIGLGALSCDLLLAVAATSLLRARIGRRAFKAVHWAAYAAWPVALAHSVGSGTDTTAAWMLIVALVNVAVVAAALCWRLADRPVWQRAAARPQGRRQAARSPQVGVR